jgi:hypothetical protein
MKAVKDAERKKSSFKRGIRFATVVLKGHLFDTKFFNFAINVLENLGIDFRVIEWELGKNTGTKS